TGGAQGQQAFLVLVPGFDGQRLDRDALTWLLPVVIIAVAAFKGVAYFIQSLGLGRVSEGIGARLRVQLFDTLIAAHAPPTQRRGDVATRVGADVDLVQQGVVHWTTAWVRDGLTLV